MIEIIKRTVIGVFVLMIFPVFALLMWGAWQPIGDSFVTKALFLITETASFPWALVTCVILAGWFCLILKLNFKDAIVITSILAVAIIVGQGVKFTIKNITKEPRPFVLWLEKEHNLDSKSFYLQPRKQRALLVDEILKSDQRVPRWLKYHWQNETGYAFPSGHTIFAATWALLAILLLWSQHCYITIITLMVWATIVATSRIILGMHQPSDLLIGILISAVIAFSTAFFIEKRQTISELIKK